MQLEFASVNKDFIKLEIGTLIIILGPIMNKGLYVPINERH